MTDGSADHAGGTAAEGELKPAATADIGDHRPDTAVTPVEAAASDAADASAPSASGSANASAPPASASADASAPPASGSADDAGPPACDSTDAESPEPSDAVDDGVSVLTDAVTATAAAVQPGAADQAPAGPLAMADPGGPSGATSATMAAIASDVAMELLSGAPETANDDASAPADTATETTAAPPLREPDEAALRLAEAAVFASVTPMTARALSQILPEDMDAAAVIVALRSRYEGRGIELSEIGGGLQFRTAADLAPRLRKVVQVPRRLPRVALETLAIVAYHQPITRPEIEDMRGASLSQQTLDVLLENDLIVARGRKETPGRPTLWGTTAKFLEYFGLRDIRELPRRQDLLLETVRPDAKPATGDGEDAAADPATDVTRDNASDPAIDPTPDSASDPATDAIPDNSSDPDIGPTPDSASDPAIGPTPDNASDPAIDPTPDSASDPREG